VVERRPANPAQTSSLRLVLSVWAGVAGLLAIAGCGSGSGVGEGASVSVYVSAPLCAEAKEELLRRGAQAGDVSVRVGCLKQAESARGRVDLAAAGADARRATQDSTTVGFVEPPGREAGFARPILEEADVSLILSSSGAKAMRTIIRDLESRGDESPREAVSPSTAGSRAPPPAPDG
jgi:hypothetical protein